MHRKLALHSGLRLVRHHFTARHRLSCVQCRSLRRSRLSRACRCAPTMPQLMLRLSPRPSLVHRIRDKHEHEWPERRCWSARSPYNPCTCPSLRTQDNARPDSSCRLLAVVRALEVDVLPHAARALREVAHVLRILLAHGPEAEMMGDGQRIRQAKGWVPCAAPGALSDVPQRLAGFDRHHAAAPRRGERSILRLSADTYFGALVRD